MIDFDNTFVHLDPQQWSMLMTWLVNILVLCVIFGSPFRFFEIDSPVCFQVQTPVTVLVLALSFWAALAMCEELRNPFDEGSAPCLTELKPYPAGATRKCLTFSVNCTQWTH
eukprot:6763542-Prymnesium_polylepis.1